MGRIYKAYRKSERTSKMMRENPQDVNTARNSRVFDLIESKEVETEGGKMMMLTLQPRDPAKPGDGQVIVYNWGSPDGGRTKGRVYPNIWLWRGQTWLQANRPRSESARAAGRSRTTCGCLKWVTWGTMIPWVRGSVWFRNNRVAVILHSV